jgi:peroxiredoxin
MLEVGVPAPSFKGPNLTGPEFQLDNVKGAKPIVLIFAPDQINPNTVNQTKGVYDRNKNDVEFVVMLRQVPGGVQMAKVFLQQFGVKFPVVYDQTQAIYKMYGVEKPVVIYAINKDGVIASALEFEPKSLNPQLIEDAIATAK